MLEKDDDIDNLNNFYGMEIKSYHIQSGSSLTALTTKGWLHVKKKLLFVLKALAGTSKE